MFRVAMILSLLVALGLPVLAFADGQNWAIGKWEGDINGMRSRKYGTHRVLTITSVAPDGAAKGSWASDETLHPPMHVDADSIHFAPGNALSRVDLKKTGADELTGTMVYGDKTYQIRLKRSAP